MADLVVAGTLLVVQPLSAKAHLAVGRLVGGPLDDDRIVGPGGGGGTGEDHRELGVRFIFRSKTSGAARRLQDLGNLGAGAGSREGIEGHRLSVDRGRLDPVSVFRLQTEGRDGDDVVPRKTRLAVGGQVDDLPLVRRSQGDLFVGPGAQKELADGGDVVAPADDGHSAARVHLRPPVEGGRRIIDKGGFEPQVAAPLPVAARVGGDAIRGVQRLALGLRRRVRGVRRDPEAVLRSGLQAGKGDLLLIQHLGRGDAFGVELGSGYLGLSGDLAADVRDFAVVDGHPGGQVQAKLDSDLFRAGNPLGRTAEAERHFPSGAEELDLLVGDQVFGHQSIGDLVVGVDQPGVHRRFERYAGLEILDGSDVHLGAVLIGLDFRDGLHHHAGRVCFFDLDAGVGRSVGEPAHDRRGGAGLDIQVGDADRPHVGSQAGLENALDRRAEPTAQIGGAHRELDIRIQLQADQGHQVQPFVQSLVKDAQEFDG